MKTHLSCKSCLTAFFSMIVVVLAAEVTNSATTTVTYQVSAGADDGYAWSAAGQDIGAAYLMVGDDRTYTAPYYMSAMRFTNIDAPRNAQIVDARLKISSISEGLRGQIYGLIRAEATDDAPDFTARYIGPISKTTAAADWDHKENWAANTYYTSPDISSVIQEVIGRDGWSSHNSIAVCYSTRTDSGKSRMFGSFEAGAGFAAVLEITYETYRISGYINTIDNTPIEGVAVSAGAGIESTTTDAAGYYELFVPPGWTGTLTASKVDIVFKPAQYTYTDLSEDVYEQNFIEYKPKISGFVHDKYGYGFEQANISADNGGASGFTDANGFYEIIVPFNWSGTVTAYKSGWRITPDGISYNNLVTDQNDQNYSAYQPTISGHAKDEEGILLPAVTIDVQGIATLFTDANGYYQIDVPYKWTGKITPGMTGCGFVPSYRHYPILTFDRTNQDFTSFQPTISGIITAYGGPLAGVTLTGNNNVGVTTTDANGIYHITVPYGWSGSITPSKPQYTFTPAQTTYNNVTAYTNLQNYTAILPPVIISGFVREVNNNPVAAVNISTDNGGGSDTTDATGYYEITVPYDWSGTVIPGKTGWNITPLSRSYSNVITNQTNQDYTAFQPKISGHVKDSNGIGVEGVTVSANNSGGSDTTNPNGYYEITVPYGWGGIVTAAKAGFNITPAGIPYINVTGNWYNRNYSAFQPTISGVITFYGEPLEGVTLTASNGGPAVTDSEGNYVLAVPYGLPQTITPSKSPYIFTPLVVSYSSVTHNISKDFTAILPPVDISGNVRDGNGNGVIGVNITADNDGGTDVTNFFGHYSVRVVHNWSGMVTAKKAAWQFIPENYDYNDLTAHQPNQDFTAFYTGIINVKPDGTGDYPTIQAAIDAAANGDAVILQPGTYSGTGNRDIDFLGKAITVRGATGDPNDCVIDCNGTQDEPHRGFNFVSGENANSVLEAITITNGYGPDENISGIMRSVGGALYCNSSGPTINNCIISYNAVASNGGGIYNGENGSPIISNCTISNNSAYYDGGGIDNHYSNSSINNSTIRNNSANNGGGIFNVMGSSTIDNCIITDNSAIWWGGGVYNYYSSPTINNCIISNNTSTANRGGGIYNRDSSSPIISNCTISNNTSSRGGGIYNISLSRPIINNTIIWDNSSQIYGAVTVKYSNIQGGYNGVGNIDADPCFADPDANDFHLTGVSPCIDAGDPNYTPDVNETDIDGDPRVIVRIDMGADEIYSATSALLVIIPGTLDFEAQGLNSSLQSQYVSINNYGVVVLNWQIEIPGDCNWENVFPTSGQLNTGESSDIEITVDPDKAGYGTNSCRLQVTSPDAENSPQAVTVNLEVLGPELAVSPAQFYYESVLTGPDTAGQILSIQNTGYDTLHWHITIPQDCNWLSAHPMSGESNGEVNEVTLSIDANGMDVGVYACELTISDPNAENNPLTVQVSLHVRIESQRHVPAEYQTIQEAIDAAVEGDEVILEPGIYNGPGNYNIYFRSKAITVRSVAPNNPAIVAATIIQPNTYASGFCFDYAEQADSVIDGLTIRLCFSGAAIDCREYSNPTIRNCIIEDNYGYYSPYNGGNGIGCYESNPVISNCVIRNNQGSGLWCVNSDSTVRNCIFTGNRGSNYYTGISLGGGILFHGGNISVINCTFSGNAADVGGGICSQGWYGYGSNMNNMTISNCIFRDNDANDGPQIALTHNNNEIPPTVSVSYSVVQGGEAAVFVDPCCTLNWGNGNLDIDPCFAAPGYWILAPYPPPPPPPPPPPGSSAAPADGNYYIWVNGDYHLKSQKGRWKPSIYIGLDPNRDDFINLLDFASFANSWRKQGGSIPADLDRTGTVELSDLTLLLNNYLASYTPGQWVLDSVTSTGIDAGDPISNWTPELWPHGKRINMGAYGGTPEAGMSLSNAGSIVDLNGDGCVGNTDIMLLTYKWLYESLLLAEDIDRNGFVNFTDLAIVANNWQGTLERAGNPDPPDAAIGAPGAPGAPRVDPNADLSWTPGYGTTSHDVYFGTSNPPPFVGNQIAATFDPGTMTWGTTYYWHIDEVGPYCTITGTTWRFTTISLEATNPYPADGATGVSTGAVLSWTPGYGTTSHDVYFGTINPPPFIGNQVAATFDPGSMAQNTIYYWRIDEVGTYGTITGSVWSFRTYYYGPPPPPY